MSEATTFEELSKVIPEKDHEMVGDLFDEVMSDESESGKRIAKQCEAEGNAVADWFKDIGKVEGKDRHGEVDPAGNEKAPPAAPEQKNQQQGPDAFDKYIKCLESAAVPEVLKLYKERTAEK